MRLALVLSILLAAGCGRPEEVRRYKAPKDPGWRMLGAVVPAKDQTWFFKVTGPEARVGAHEEEILVFLRSLKLEGEEIRWTLPPGWTEERGSGERISSLRFGVLEPKLVMSVTTLAGEGGGMLPNVNRWRGQLGLSPLAEADLATQLKKVPAGGLDVSLVDLRSARRPSGPPMAAGGAAPPPSRREEKPSLDSIRSLFAFDPPPGWTENPRPSQQRIFEFQTAEGALVTFSGMPGDAGGLAGNVNRWREQAGLAPLKDAEAAATARSLRFLGASGWIVEAVGPERGVLVAFSMIPFGSEGEISFFLKMSGSAGAVAAQKDAFERFAISFRMGSRR